MRRSLILPAVFLGAGVLLLPIVPAAAAPFTYIESVHGDLVWPGQNQPLPTFTADVGLNTVSASMTVDFDPPLDPPDLDGFAFIVPDGLEVTSIKFIGTKSVGHLTSLGWHLTTGNRASNHFQPSGEVLDAFVAPALGDYFVANTPLGPGVYAFTLVSWGTGAPGALSGVSTADYTFILDVHQQVPEPAALTVLAPATLALLRRRRR